MTIKYVLPFLISFSLTVLLLIVGIVVGKKVKWSGRDSERHIHHKGVLRIGGIAMVLAFNLTIILDRNLVITSQLAGVMAASLLVLFVGVWDDLKEMDWKTQFFSQLAIAILIFIMGVRIFSVTNLLTGQAISLESGLGVFFSILLVIVWVTLMINSMNWLDGIDGLSGGVTLIGALTIFFLSLKPEVNQPPMAILAMILAGTALGFLIFNFHPSQILAGTSGSTFMGFILAALAIFAGTKIATSILVMALPVIDFLWVIGERLWQRKSIFKPDRKHLHYKLLDLGWSQERTALYFYTVTALLAAVALNTRVIGKGITILVTGAIMTISLAVINRKIKKSNYPK